VVEDHRDRRGHKVHRDHRDHRDHRGLRVMVSPVLQVALEIVVRVLLVQSFAAIPFTS
tara:strand:- start:169 stop:342 length:174 start_codon:yes stop_codon:yes gene_type:complete